MFQSYAERLCADSQIIVQRQPTLVYYTYLHRLNERNSFFGVSVLVNGVETSSFKSLFRLFERIFQRIVSDDIVLTISAQGDITNKEIQLSPFTKYLNDVAVTIQEYINDGESCFMHMFPMNMSAGQDDYCFLSLGGRESELLQKLQSYNSILITKNTNTSGAGLKGLALRIEHLNEQLEYQKERNEELEKMVSGHVDSGWKITASAFIGITIVLLLIILYGTVSGLITINY